MRLTARGKSENASFRANTPSFQAEAMTEIMLGAFEAEIDALLELVGQDNRRAASSEALIRRYATAEDLWDELDEDYRRLQLKMLMLSDALAGGTKRRASSEAG